MSLLFGFRKNFNHDENEKRKQRKKRKKRKMEMKKEKKKHRLMLLLMLMLMLWNNITSLHTAVKTISSSILAETEKRKFYSDKHLYVYI
jgi:hypothetical protein